MPTKISHIQFMSLYNSGMNDREIAEALGIHRVTIGEYRRNLNLPSNWQSKELTEQEKNQIVELYNKDLSFREIAEEIGSNYGTVLTFCKNKGLDTSKERLYKFSKKKKFEAVLEYLKQHGPTTQDELSEKLEIGMEHFPQFTRKHFDEIERFKFKRGQGKRIRLVTEIYGDLLQCGNLFCIRDDERIIDFVAARVPLNPKTEEDAKAILNHLKLQLGYDRARKVVEKLGYEYRTGPPDNFKFTDEKFLEYYNEGLIDREVADILGVSQSAVSLRRRILNLPPHGKSGRKKKLIQCPQCGHEFTL